MEANIAGTSKTPVRILLADTGAVLCEQLTTMLSEVRCEVLHACDGFEVLCRLPELRPDILLIASDLPRLSGIQVCSLLRQSPDFSGLPVLVLCGSNALLDKVRAKMAGANACLETPFRRADLQAALVELFKKLPDHDQPPVRESLKESIDDGQPAHC